MSNAIQFSPDDRMCTGTKGAMHELVVAVDLLRCGFDVFRAQSPACSCDLVVIRGKRTVRIEVRTGQITKAGRLTWPTAPRDVGRQDVYAIVTGESDIRYFPPMDQWGIPIRNSLPEGFNAIPGQMRP